MVIFHIFMQFDQLPFVGDTWNLSQSTRHTRKPPSNPPPAVRRSSLSAETVQRAALSLQGVDDKSISGDGLALGVFGVGDGVTNHVLEEDLQNTTRLLVDQTRNSLDTTSPSQNDSVAGLVIPGCYHEAPYDDAWRNDWPRIFTFLVSKKRSGTLVSKNVTFIKIRHR